MARKRPVKNRPKTEQKRDKQGRFLSGTAPGPGRPHNPYSRQLGRLKASFAEAFTTEDMAGLAQKLLRLAMGGDIGAAKLLLAALVGPPLPVHPDRLDEDEMETRRHQPTELDELLLLVQRNGSNGHVSKLAAVEDIEDDKDTPEPESESDGPDVLTSREEFAAGRLEWDPQFACPLDLLYLQYARWCGKSGLPLLAEADVCTWLRENGAIVRTSTYTQTTQAQGVRVVE